jgi:hypothetical protein
MIQLVSASLPNKTGTRSMEKPSQDSSNATETRISVLKKKAKEVLCSLENSRIVPIVLVFACAFSYGKVCHSIDGGSLLHTMLGCDIHMFRGP